jgi:hypothetical protein
MMEGTGERRAYEYTVWCTRDVIPSELPTNPSIEGKEETGQRRKAVLIGRVVKIEERARIGDRRHSVEETYSCGPVGRMTEVSKVSGAAYVFPTQAENAVTEILSLRAEVSSVAP